MSLRLQQNSCSGGQLFCCKNVFFTRDKFCLGFNMAVSKTMVSSPPYSEYGLSNLRSKALFFFKVSFQELSIIPIYFIRYITGNIHLGKRFIPQTFFNSPSSKTPKRPNISPRAFPAKKLPGHLGRHDLDSFNPALDNYARRIIAQSSSQFKQILFHGG